MSYFMDSLADGVDLSPMNRNCPCCVSKKLGSKSVYHSCQCLLSPELPPRSELDFVSDCAGVPDCGAKRVGHPGCSVVDRKDLCMTIPDSGDHEEELPITAKDYYRSRRRKSGFEGCSEKLTEIPAEEKVLMVENKACIKQAIDDLVVSSSSASLDSETRISKPCEDVEVQSNNDCVPQSAVNFPSPRSLYAASQYVEANESFTNTEVSRDSSIQEKSAESVKVSSPCDVESRSSGSDVSDWSSSSTLSSTMHKRHRANDRRWEAIQAVRSQTGSLEFRHFKLLLRLGCGDIGSVYLSELIGTKTYFAMKIMDKAALVARNKLLRAQTELEILQSLDHPFLPTLYTHFETRKSSCLVMEFCPGGDLHVLRQRQPGKCFSERSARFYVAEVLLALEYLHMLGIIYRDLKPENVLVRDDGHIMLSDFDLSLRCVVCPTLVKSLNFDSSSKTKPTSCVKPNCMVPACFGPSFFTNKPRKNKRTKPKTSDLNHQSRLLPELIAEPTSARSMSFVGTHEYLAPEIIKGEGHGSAVDWWTFGIFLYELLFGKTPFKGDGNRATLFKVVGQPLTFPESPTVSFAARDLIRGLLVKEPQHRLAYRRGATEIKQHPFFQNVNWALIRCTNPPEVPKKVRAQMQQTITTTNSAAADVNPIDNYYEIDFF